MPEELLKKVAMLVEETVKAPPTERLDEALRAPATWRPAETDEEALEIKPFIVKLEAVVVATPPRKVVPETLTLPWDNKLPTVNNPDTEEEALEINPPTKVAVGLIAKVVIVEVATPLKNTELEALRLPLENKLPETVRGELMEEEAELINPPVRVERPDCNSVPDALTLPEEST